MDHYLASKGFQHPENQYGLRQAYEPFNGYEPFGTGTASLIVPVMDIDGTIHSLQFIAPDGRKRFYPGGKLCKVTLDSRKMNGILDPPSTSKL